MEAKDMTNKPMLSVERELLESLHSENQVERIKAFNELRALLEQETPEQEGVRLARNNPNLGSNLWGKTHRVGDEFTRLGDAYYAEALKLPPAAQHQGEPVAWVECSPAWLKAGGYCATAPRICVGREGISHLHPAHSSAEQPAPVAVPHTMRSVMEAYEAAQKNHLTGTSNFCAAMAARLNGVKP